MPARSFTERSSTVTSNIEVVGLKEALKTLNKIDKSLRREITKDYKKIVQPVIDDAKNLVPTKAPLSGMARAYKYRSGYEVLPWVDGFNQRIIAKINTRNIKENNAGDKVNVGTFMIQWQGATGTLFDTTMAGSLGKALTARYGSRSRVMWRAYEQRRDDVIREMEQLVRRVMDEANRETA
jgi:hypothetical protein